MKRVWRGILTLSNHLFVAAPILHCMLLQAAFSSNFLDTWRRTIIQNCFTLTRTRNVAQRNPCTAT